MLNINRLSLDDARLLADRAKAKAAAIGVPMCIAVCDESGHLIQFERMDGSKVSGISISIDKAFTAAVSRNGTHVYGALAQPGQPAYGIQFTHGGRFSILGGALPVIVDGTIVGSIGISSGTPAEDLAVAEAALADLDLQSGLRKGHAHAKA